MPNILLTSEQRYEQRKRYYKKHRANKKNSKNILTEEELKLIYQKSYSDVELSKIINRSVQAIQTARWRIKNDIYKINL